MAALQKNKTKEIPHAAHEIKRRTPRNSNMEQERKSKESLEASNLFQFVYE